MAAVTTPPVSDIVDGAALSGSADVASIMESSTVSFRHADLSHADLRDSRQELTDFDRAKLDGADLRGTDLSSARNLTPAQLASARTDAATRLPRW